MYIFLTVLHVQFIYYFYIICQRQWNSRLFLVWGLVHMCSLICANVKQDRFQLLLSFFFVFFPSHFISLCLQITLCISKNTHFHVFLGIKIVEWQISICGFLEHFSFFLSSSVSSDLVRSRNHEGSHSTCADLRLL